MNCSKCGEYTEERSFATFKSRKGETRRRGVCKKCRQKYQEENFEALKKYRHEYNKKNRTKKAIESDKRRTAVKQVINKIKSEVPCADCGNYFPSVAMDFDHVRGKNKSIASMVSQAYKIDLILEEIKLCDIVCACCHRVRTSNRRQNHAPRKDKGLT